MTNSDAENRRLSLDFNFMMENFICHRGISEDELFALAGRIPEAREEALSVFRTENGPVPEALLHDAEEAGRTARKLVFLGNDGETGFLRALCRALLPEDPTEAEEGGRARISVGNARDGESLEGLSKADCALLLPGASHLEDRAREDGPCRVFASEKEAAAFLLAAAGLSGRDFADGFEAAAEESRNLNTYGNVALMLGFLIYASLSQGKGVPDCRAFSDRTEGFELWGKRLFNSVPGLRSDKREGADVSLLLQCADSESSVLRTSSAAYALRRAGRLSMTLTLPELSPFTWGELTATLRLAALFAGKMSGAMQLAGSFAETEEKAFRALMGEKGFEKVLEDVENCPPLQDRFMIEE